MWTGLCGPNYVDRRQKDKVNFGLIELDLIFFFSCFKNNQITMK